MRGTAISSTGSYLPDTIVRNQVHLLYASDWLKLTINQFAFSFSTL